MIAVQTLLDRNRHSPGVIDAELIRSLIETQGAELFQTYTITAHDVDGPFYDVPSSFTAKAELDRLGYESPRELLAEKFHMDQDFLAAPNPGVDFSQAGTTINVVANGDGQLPGDVARIEVRKDESAVVAVSSDGTILASYPATIGSSEFPNPSGTMEVVAVAPDPKYYFDPEGRD